MIRYIYTFFVGLFLVIFIGFGIATFYPEPKAPDSPPYYGESLTSSEKRAQVEFDKKQKAYNEKIADYNRNVSIIILLCAVITLAISLGFSEKLGVLADGLLLGGIFTLLYGTGRGLATDSNQFRFLVASAGLAITLILGYLKFIKAAKTR